MANAEEAVLTERRDGQLIAITIRPGTKVLQGTFAIMHAYGHALGYNETFQPNYRCLGVWSDTYENETDEDIVGLAYRKSQFLVSNSTQDPLRIENLGSEVFAEDNQTVTMTDGGGERFVAGRFMGFDTENPSYVWVEIE